MSSPSPRPPPYNLGIGYDELSIMKPPSSTEALVEDRLVISQIIDYTQQIRSLTQLLPFVVASKSSAKGCIRSTGIPESKELSKIDMAFTELVWKSQETAIKSKVIIDDFSATVLKYVGSRTAKSANKASELEKFIQAVNAEKVAMDKNNAKVQTLTEDILRLREKIDRKYTARASPATSNNHDENTDHDDRPTSVTGDRNKYRWAVYGVAATLAVAWSSKLLLAATVIGFLYWEMSSEQETSDVNARCDSPESRERRRAASEHNLKISEQCLPPLEDLANHVGAYSKSLRGVSEVFGLLEKESTGVIALLNSQSGDDLPPPTLRDKVEALQSLLPSISSALQSYASARVVV
ncbi:hypothetical protein DFH11DRAFT_1584163 [Phellopilus nigrolimitatus]|nr:hypothetical protein DFH11DRAFT_1584163 [Phellopilus nigrolimitatus]